MITIVGAGFGLYGYLPAVINVSQSKVILSEQYRQCIETRPELDRYLGSIDWQPSIEAALKRASGVIIAVPPHAQKYLVEQALSKPALRTLIIEKPVTPSPDDAIALTETIYKCKKQVRVGYTFLYTNWCKELKKKLQLPIEVVYITWRFKANHFSRNKETWKRYHSAGGGALRFYGIHVIATLASAGYSEAKLSILQVVLPDQPESWSAKFTGVGLPLCEVSLSTNADQNIFRIDTFQKGESIKTIHFGTSPFEAPEPSSQGQDVRVPVLERLIRSFEQDDQIFMELYRSVNDLWKSAESRLQVVKLIDQVKYE